MATNLFSKAAAYRKKHKGMTMPEAVKAVSKGKVSGTKSVKAKAKVGAKPKAKVSGPVKRKRISGTELVLIKTPRSKTHNPIAKANKLNREIDSLEQQRKNAKGKQMKDLYAHAINAKHREISTISQKLKSK